MSNRPIHLELGEYEITVAELASQMSEGQQVYMANHLWKHYGVGPQKLVKQLESDEPDEFVVVNGYVYRLSSEARE